MSSLFLYLYHKLLPFSCYLKTNFIYLYVIYVNDFVLFHIYMHICAYTQIFCNLYKENIIQQDLLSYPGSGNALNRIRMVLLFLQEQGSLFQYL